ncbi:hypothetical protein [Nocardia aurea]|uniref:hypothetical protein n=1 Tax=Nocardia aurea TaxID=2144174 RepID=UPI0018E53AAD|nr:hypothetical protein [Nocardia aurea]
MSGPAPPGAPMRIRYLLLHAYGLGGTIRTVFNQASAMAALGHQVEIVSVVRAAGRVRRRLLHRAGGEDRDRLRLLAA